MESFTKNWVSFSHPARVLQTGEIISYVLYFGPYFQLTNFAFGPSECPLVSGLTYRHIGGIFLYSDYGRPPLDRSPPPNLKVSPSDNSILIRF